MNDVASLGWFARHELRLLWRNWSDFLSGRRWFKQVGILLGIVILAALMHLIAYALIRRQFSPDMLQDPSVLVMVMGGVALAFAMLLSQSLESVTKAFYTRDDFDLLLSSPAPSHQLFVIRIIMRTLSNTVMMALMVAPFINMAIMLGGAHWLAAYGVVAALSVSAMGVGILTTIGLFRWVGPRRTRTVSQVLAAVVGASLIVGVQIATILSYGTMKRWTMMDADVVAAMAPPVDSPVWLPIWAASGDVTSLMLLFALGAAIFAVALWQCAVQFSGIVQSAFVEAGEICSSHVKRTLFKPMSLQWLLVQKEWMLLWRDPWLISQSLMQVLYLVPPLVMLWISFGDRPELAAVLAPVIVMAVGQLAGGLSWLSNSGEDAPDLIATSPVGRSDLLFAKVTSVLAIALTVSAPMILALSLLSMRGAVVTFICITMAALCAITIQIWFRKQSGRSMFRRRQSASKASTICEAIASILCAATAALGAVGNSKAIVPAMLLIVLMGIAWLLSPEDDS